MKTDSFVAWVFNNRDFKEILSRFLLLIIGYPLLLFSYLVPRNKKKWVFGYKVGFADNAKYMYRYMYEHEKLVESIWISSNRNEISFLRKEGFVAHYRWSITGVFHSLTASCYLFSSHLSDINYWTSGGCYAINLWHGVGIKKIEFATTVGADAKVYKNSIVNRILFPHLFRKPDLFLSTSDFMSQHFARCFQIDIQCCINFGYPRCDLFFENTIFIKEYVQDYESEEMNSLLIEMDVFSHTIIYMPTFRDDQSDFLKTSGIHLNLMNHFLQRNNLLLLFKLHPATRIPDIALDFSNIRFLDKHIDIYPILPFTDLLVTDYSSIYYDYLLLNKGILLFPFDYAEYILKCRDLAFDFDEYTPGIRAYDFDTLIAILSIWNFKNGLTLEQIKIKEKFWGESPIENACAVLTHYIKQKC